MGRIGPENISWKGGKCQDKDGYVHVSIKYWYPDIVHYYPKKHRLPEHVALMSRYLGRALIRGETVHHKNGIRHDNQIENLELWNKPQPAGCRVEDQIGWAVQILRRYAPEKLQ